MLAFLGDDIGEVAIDVARHPLGVATDIEINAVLAAAPPRAAGS
jgi:hypothetical protein